jgi:hypothetical protein
MSTPLATPEIQVPPLADGEGATVGAVIEGISVMETVK